MTLWRYLLLSILLIFPVIPFFWFYLQFTISILPFLIPVYAIITLAGIILSFIPSNSFLDKRKEDYVLIPLISFPYLYGLFYMPMSFYSLSISAILILMAWVVLRGKS